ncbi:MAG: helix-turn-helix domain-containing protein [Angustibacter sp.]
MANTPDATNSADHGLVVQQWTGAEAKQLRAALRLSSEAFAEKLGVSSRAVTRWEGRGATLTPRPDTQAMLDTVLARANPGERERFMRGLQRGKSATRLRSEELAAGDNNETHEEQLPMLDTETDPWGTDEIYRPALLRSAVVGSSGPGGIGLGLAVPTLTLDDIRHLCAAVDDARYLDGTVVGYLNEGLVQAAEQDGRQGPRTALSPALAVVGVVEQRAREADPTVRRELLQAGARGAEFIGWLYRDLGMPELADYWRDRSTEWALEAGDQALPGYVLLKKSQSAWDAREAVRMLTLATAAQSRSWRLPKRIRAEAIQQEARGLAMVDGDVHAALGKLDEAQELVESGSDDEGLNESNSRTDSDKEKKNVAQNTKLAGHYNHSLLKLQTAICLHQVGQPSRAVEIYQEVLEPAVHSPQSRLSPLSPRDQAYFQTLMGHSLAAAGRPEEAAEAGLKALPVAVAATSLRTVAELRRLRHHMRPWMHRPAVQEFCQATPG